MPFERVAAQTSFGSRTGRWDGLQPTLRLGKHRATVNASVEIKLWETNITLRELIIQGGALRAARAISRAFQEEKCQKIPRAARAGLAICK